MNVYYQWPYGDSYPLNIDRKAKTNAPGEFTHRSQFGGQKSKHITGGIPRWSPTLVLVARFSAYVWQSGRDAQLSLTYGRM
jgi:hypothetical protein